VHAEELMPGTLPLLQPCLPKPRILNRAGTAELRTNGKKFGEVIVAPVKQIKVGVWSKQTAFAQTELCRTAYHLGLGKIYLPGRGKIGSIPLIKLSELGELGPDRRDIHDGFELSNSSTAYAAIWGHDTESLQKISQLPNQFLTALAKARPGRPYRDPHLLWSRAGRLLIAERLWLETIRVVSIYLPQPVLSNTWWPLAIHERENTKNEDIETILSLWFNSTLGVLSLIAARVDTRGPWIEMKKPTLNELPVLNPLSLTDSKRKKLVRLYDSLSAENLRRLPEINNDEVREQIDCGIMSVLGIPEDLKSLRDMISQEPLLMGS